jgi:hypothetical protein
MEGWTLYSQRSDKDWGLSSASSPLHQLAQWVEGLLVTKLELGNQKMQDQLLPG